MAAVLLPLLFYLACGAAAGFFAADDFVWLTGARDGSWEHLFEIGNGDRFYRPVVQLWFAGAVRVCGDATACYHALQLGLHAIAGVLLFVLTCYLSHDRLMAFLTTLVFMMSPGYAEAVLWISCATEVLCAVFMLAAVLLTTRAADTRSRKTWILAALCTLAAVFSHEAGIALFLLIPTFLYLTGRARHISSADVWPFVVIAILFTVMFVLANYRNRTLVEGDYRLGTHMIRNALDYLVSLYIGRHAIAGYLTVALAFTAIARFGPAHARLGIAWMLLTMAPFLGFTSGNTSRYLYAPTMGFALVVGAMLIALFGWLRAHSHRVEIAALTFVLAAFIVARFGAFTREAIQDRLEWFSAYQEYATEFERTHPAARQQTELTAPMPTSRDMRAEFVQPLLRWTLKSPTLVVRLEPGGGSF